MFYYEDRILNTFRHSKHKALIEAFSSLQCLKSYSIKKSMLGEETLASLKLEIIAYLILISVGCVKRNRSRRTYYPIVPIFINDSHTVWRFIDPSLRARINPPITSSSGVSTMFERVRQAYFLTFQNESFKSSTSFFTIFVEGFLQICDKVQHAIDLFLLYGSERHFATFSTD